MSIVVGSVANVPMYVIVKALEDSFGPVARASRKPFECQYGVVYFATAAGEVAALSTGTVRIAGREAKCVFYMLARAAVDPDERVLTRACLGRLARVVNEAQRTHRQREWRRLVDALTAGGSESEAASEQLGHALRHVGAALELLTPDATQLAFGEFLPPSLSASSSQSPP